MARHRKWAHLKKYLFFGTEIGHKNTEKSRDLRLKIRENAKPGEWILKRDDYKTQFVLDDYYQRCNIVIQLTNEIDKFDRILKFYILNFRDYFKIKVLKTVC